MKHKKKKPTAPRHKPPPAPRMMIRRNAPPALALAPAAAAPAPAPTRPRNALRLKPKTPRKAMGARIKGMRGTHVAAGLGAGTVGNALGVLAVGKGWIGPKVTAGILMGTGIATTAAGWYWDADHVMAAGTGLAAAGTFSLANLFAVNAYEAAEKKAKEKKAARDSEAREEARKLVAEESARQQQRNGPGFRVIELVREDQVEDADMVEEEDDADDDDSAAADADDADADADDADDEQDEAAA